MPEPSLADLSRNASVISSSSDSESTVLDTPRPRPTRTFSSPRSRSPHSPPSQAIRPPTYLTRELGVGSEDDPAVSRQAQARSKSRKRSRSQNPSANTRLSAQDFVFGETLGEGSYSTVMRARYARSGHEYAIKILDKNHLIRKEKMLVALAEKNTLVKLGAGHPGIIHLHWTFQDEWSLFFVLDLAPNGEMQSRISRMGSLSLECARYYTAQLVDAIEYMHDKGVIHRDLKPENLLLDGDFRIKITDFGTGKILETGEERANSFVGTAQYVSPELLERNETSKSSDLWSLGCIVFQMIAGRFAFQGLSEYLTWQKIKSLDYSFPDGFDQNAKDFVTKLLVRDPKERLGASRTASSPSPLRVHPFLTPIHWDTLWTDPSPPLVPGLVRKDPQGLSDADGEDALWNDVGAKWDALVVGDTEGTLVNGHQHRPAVDADGIGWAEDAQGPEFERYKLKDATAFRRTSRIVEEVGPMGELPDYTLATASGDPVDANANGPDVSPSYITIPQTATMTTTIPIPIHSATHNGNPPGSGTSSSNGSLVDKTGAAVTVAELDRGRPRAQTPVQGNGLLHDADVASLLLPGEEVVWSTRVEARSPKRRGSRLRLPISVSPIRPKPRQLLLTNQRLVCVKVKEGHVKIKSACHLGAVESAARKSEREFVVLTATTSQTYATETRGMAGRWTEVINAALVPST